MQGFWIRSAVLITLICFGHTALASTEISGNLEGDQVWTAANSPYIVSGSVNISAATPGSTLRVEPGVTVQFGETSSLNIFGNLVANGTATEPIKFIGDPANSSNNWDVAIFDSTQSEMSHLEIIDTGNGVLIFNSKLQADNLKAQNGSYGLMLFDSEADMSGLNFSHADILADNSTVNISGLTVQQGSLLTFDTVLDLHNASINSVDSGFGLLADSSQITVSGLSINNAEAGINLSGGTTGNLQDISISGLTNGLGISIDNSEVNINGGVVSTGPAPGIGIDNGSNVTINNLDISNFLSPSVTVNNSSLNGVDINITNNLIGLTSTDSNVGLTHSTIKDSEILGIGRSNGSFQISDSIISGHSIAGLDSSGAEPLDATGNFWGHPGGPTLDPMNPETVSLGDGIMGNVLYEPWLSEYCESACYSNIMLLPGIMASRLYEGDNQLWEPGALTKDSEFEPLYLDESGKSINSNIVTKDVLDNGLAYGKFVEDLETLKADDTINDYEAAPYDWRLSMEDVLNTGIKNDDSTIVYGSATDEPYVENTLRRLASTSKSGKVTIVAHSNGGLITKALINKLDDEAADLIDKIIFVGVPQLGTPQAIGSLLHGYNAGLPSIYPFVLSPERARDLAINMPMIYQLMPFTDYYSSEGVSVNTPYVTFEDGTVTQTFIDEYGYAITPDELADFLNGAEGRLPATYEDLENPINANALLLAKALDTQQEINSAWNLPEGIKVHQIAGTGEDTLAGITYKTIKKCSERSLLFVCKRHEDALSYTPNTVVDGDGTVVVSSALAMSGRNDDAERWWVDLDDYNGIRLDLFRTKHANLLEVSDVREFIINNLLFNENSFNPEYIYSNPPPINGDRLVFVLHSPLYLSAVDGHGNVISETESTIPGANYQRYGEVQLLTMSVGTEFTLILTGEAEGSFTLEMEEFEGEEKVVTSTFSAIPSSTSTLATITFEEGGLEDAGVLKVDYDGDSTVDLTYTPVLGEEVYTPDPIKTTETGSIAIGGYTAPQPQVLGASTELTLEQLTELIKQLNIAVQALNILKEEISNEQYEQISKHLLTLTNMANQLLLNYEL